ncbi:MAG: DUF1667 domain-containing protein [Bacillota bacterium]
MGESFSVTCIVCPIGCEVTVLNGPEVEVKGNRCDKGREYALSEYRDPRRVLTSTVRTTCDDCLLLPVRTDRPIPKRLLFPVATALARVVVQSPVRTGDVIIGNVLGTGASIIATSDLSQGCHVDVG